MIDCRDLSYFFSRHLQCNVGLANSRLHCCTAGSTESDHSASQEEHEHCPLEVPYPTCECFVCLFSSDSVNLSECAFATL